MAYEQNMYGGENNSGASNSLLDFFFRAIELRERVRHSKAQARMTNANAERIEQMIPGDIRYQKTQADLTEETARGYRVRNVMGELASDFYKYKNTPEELRESMFGDKHQQYAYMLRKEIAEEEAQQAASKNMWGNTAKTYAPIQPLRMGNFQGRNI